MLFAQEGQQATWSKFQRALNTTLTFRNLECFPNSVLARFNLLFQAVFFLLRLSFLCQASGHAHEM